MNRILTSILFLTASLAISACGAQHKSDTKMKLDHEDPSGQKANQLINETSPYLLQHAYNPVDWHAWNSETLEKAKKEGKLMIISIGYAACHWCHVMEHESFEDSIVAVKMNANYIPVKVDREERPDIDQIYMNAAYMITGRGGWPLNTIALPDGRPVYAGTYFPKDKWIELLDYFSDLYRTDPARLQTQAAQVTEGINGMDDLPFNPEPAEFTMEMLNQVWSNWQPKIDYRNGGRTGAPKFMMPNNYDFMLRYYDLSGNRKVLEAVEVTLEKMAFGGLYDQAGGGFARYSTDEIWKVPHFEKMLYDNGQLVSLYSQAYQLTGKPLYKEIVEETLTFVERELMDRSNGFYSSLDADSEGEEGKFYIWNTDELKKILGDEFEFIADYYNLTENGNWEHGNNILMRKNDDAHFIEKYGITQEELDKKVISANKKMMNVRSKRVRPGLDDKILTSWNALMLKGYVDAYRAFNKAEYLSTAMDNANFLLEECRRNDGGLNRNYKNGRSTINGFLDDYSLTIEAFIDLYQATFDEKWLNTAHELADYTIKHFYDADSKMFYYTSDEDAALIARKKEISDNVISSSNSSMAQALFYLGHYYYNDEYIEIASAMLNNVKDQVLANGPFYANWASLMTHFVQPVYEVAIAGDAAQSMRSQMDANYLPNVIFLGGKKEGNLELMQNKLIEGQTTIYVCQDKTCKLPVTESSKAIELMNN